MFLNFSIAIMILMYIYIETGAQRIIPLILTKLPKTTIAAFKLNKNEQCREMKSRRRKKKQKQKIEKISYPIIGTESQPFEVYIPRQKHLILCIRRKPNRWKKHERRRNYYYRFRIAAKKVHEMRLHFLSFQFIVGVGCVSCAHVAPQSIPFTIEFSARCLRYYSFILWKMANILSGVARALQNIFKMKLENKGKSTKNSKWENKYEQKKGKFQMKQFCHQANKQAMHKSCENRTKII